MRWGRRYDPSRRLGHEGQSESLGGALPIGRQVEDEGGGGEFWAGFVDEDDALAGFEPAHALPVGGFVIGGNVEGKVEGFTDAFAVEAEALEPVIGVGGLVAGVLRRNQNDESPISAVARPYKIGRAETLCGGGFTGKMGHVELDGRDGVCHAKTAGAAARDEVVHEDEGEQGLGRAGAPETGGERTLVGETTFPQNGDAGGGLGKRADGEAFESAFADFAKQGVVFGHDAFVIDQRAEALGEDGDAAIGEDVDAFKIDGERGLLEAHGLGVELIEDHERPGCAWQGDAEILADGGVVGDEEVLPHAGDAGGFANGSVLGARGGGKAQRQPVPAGEGHQKVTTDAGRPSVLPVLPVVCEHRDRTCRIRHRRR